MREKLNENPIAQVAVIGVLLVLAAIFFLSSSGGEEEEGGEASSSEVTATVAGSGATPEEAVDGAVESLESGAATGSVAPPAPMTAPPLPHSLTAAYESGRTVVLLFVHDGGIDDRLVAATTANLAALPGVTTFVVSAAHVSRYAAITQGLDLNRVPALIVIRPKRLNEAVPTASVSYGFQSGASAVQAVIDAGYEGPTVDYHP